MYNVNVKPVEIVEPVKCLRSSISTRGYFKKKFIDSEGNCFTVEIDIKKKTGTFTKYLDKEFKTPAIEANLKKLKGANKLFEEAEYEYAGITMQLM